MHFLHYLILCSSFNHLIRREGELLARQKDVKKISELIYLELTVSHIEVEKVSKLSKRQPDAFFHLPEVSISSSMIGK